MIGLILIAIGTGGIKPCVAAFGGDQFGEEHVRHRTSSLGCTVYIVFKGYNEKMYVKLVSKGHIYPPKSILSVN